MISRSNYYYKAPGIHKYPLHWLCTFISNWMGFPNKVHEYGRFLLHLQSIESHKLAIITFFFFDIEFSELNRMKIFVYIFSVNVLNGTNLVINCKLKTQNFFYKTAANLVIQNNLSTHTDYKL